MPAHLCTSIWSHEKLYPNINYRNIFVKKENVSRYSYILVSPMDTLFHTSMGIEMNEKNRMGPHFLLPEQTVPRVQMLHCCAIVMYKSPGNKFIEMYLQILTIHVHCTFLYENVARLWQIPSYSLVYWDNLTHVLLSHWQIFFSKRCTTKTSSYAHCSLQWRHNGRDGVWTHQPHHCLLNRLFGRRSKKTSKLRVTGLCAHKWPVTRKMSISWRHHGSM